MPENNKASPLAFKPVTLDRILDEDLAAHEKKPVAVDKHGKPLTPAQLAFKARHRRQRSSFFNPVTGVREEL
jgi:hypothetical protein